MKNFERKPQVGMSLVEVLIAMIVFAIMALGISRMLGSALANSYHNVFEIHSRGYVQSLAEGIETLSREELGRLADGTQTQVQFPFAADFEIINTGPGFDRFLVNTVDTSTLASGIEVPNLRSLRFQETGSDQAVSIDVWIDIEIQRVPIRTGHVFAIDIDYLFDNRSGSGAPVTRTVFVPNDSGGFNSTTHTLNARIGQLKNTRLMYAPID